MRPNETGIALTGVEVVIILYLLAAPFACQADVTNTTTTAITTNWVATTNWISAPASYRMLNGKLHDASQPPWESLGFTPSHYWNASHQMFAPLSSGYSPRIGSGVGVETNQPSQSPAGTKLFRLSSSTVGTPRIQILVRNVPLTAQDLLDGGAAGLARTLNIRAFPVTSRTNMNGFKIESIHRDYDYGLPYSRKVPSVTRKPVYTTNLLETP